jgi:glucose-1-phosphate cytidylyltransferase
MRLKELTDEIPKPLVPIGHYPVLWHVMKLYSYFGYNDFVLCLGYLGKKVEEYFRENNHENWNITFAHTGEQTNTGGRIRKIQKHVGGETFMCNYSDGLADLDIPKLEKFHNQHGKIATVTVLQPYSQFGILELNKNNEITRFKEKPKLDFYINGGFFVFEPEIFDYLNDDSVLEKQPFEKLAAKRQLVAYKHHGFWKCMDTFKDNTEFNELWRTGNAPWKMWKN